MGDQPSQSPAQTVTRVPAVSVVLPVYNGARYLGAALESVLDQSFTDFELIVVDDCSTDETPQILADAAARDPRLRMITNAKNRKLPASLNVGFAQARADWFCWTSDDNLMLPDALAQLIRARDNHPDADIIHADYRVIDTRGVEQTKVVTGPASDLLVENTIGCCFLYRRGVDDHLNGYDETLFGIEDYDFWLRAHRAGFAFHHVNSAPYLYRRHEGSLTDTRARKIQSLLYNRLAAEVRAMKPSNLRARALFRLATRNPFAFRPHLLLLAAMDSPSFILLQSLAILRWLRASLRVRMGRVSGN